MDAPPLISVLKRLAEARCGPQRLDLPPDLRPETALEAIREVVRVLDPDIALSIEQGSLEAARVHIDGASRGNPGPAGIGIAIFDPEGGLRERIHESIGEATNNVAEYRALLAALDRALALGIQELEVRSDSELLVRQLQGKYQVKHPGLKPLFAAARERIARLRRFRIQHVPREQNAEADALANQGIDEAAQAALARAREDWR
ncbi:MAG TPA: ribonuclease HI family protein [Candidatus Baltobacteraceae bacterium]|nr:ribonuclease HI family protein [Candidatus Baltobacteraceae bacterium]